MRSWEAEDFTRVTRENKKRGTALSFSDQTGIFRILLLLKMWRSKVCAQLQHKAAIVDLTVFKTILRAPMA